QDMRRVSRQFLRAKHSGRHRTDFRADRFRTADVRRCVAQHPGSFDVGMFQQFADRVPCFAGYIIPIEVMIAVSAAAKMMMQVVWLELAPRPCANSSSQEAAPPVVSLREPIQ